jgi:hypothetical protein
MIGMRHDKIPQGGNMKKLLVIAALLALTFTAFGQVQLSAGAGARFSPTWITINGKVGSAWEKIVTSQSMIAGKAFVDAKYVEIDVGFLTNLKSVKMVYTNSAGADISNSGDGNVGTWIVIAGLVKYPFNVGGAEVFPLLGVEYDLNLSLKNSSGNDVKSTMSSDQKANLNRFWLLAGAGADISVSKSIYIRPEAVFGYKLLSKLEQDAIDADEAATPGLKETMTNIKVDIGLAVGFKF